MIIDTCHVNISSYLFSASVPDRIMVVFGFDHQNEAVKYDPNNARTGHNGHLRMFSGIYVTHLYARPFFPLPYCCTCVCVSYSKNGILKRKNDTRAPAYMYTTVYLARSSSCSKMMHNF